jgi:hypothetical protein
MRLALIALVIVNAALAVWIGLDAARARERAQTLAALVGEASQIRIVTDLRAMSDPVPEAAVAPEVASAPAASTRRECLRWGPFAADELARARDAAEAIVGAGRAVTITTPATTTWWVYVPPTRTRDAAERKLIELRRLGVRDTFLVTDPPEYRYAISLGLFRTEEAARRFLDAQKNRGVRSARAGERTLQVKLSALVLPAAAPRAKLETVAASFAGTTLEPADCAGQASTP